MGAVELAGSGTWIIFMRKVPDEPRAEIVAAEEPHAQQAVLRYRTVGSVGETTEGGSSSAAPGARNSTSAQVGTLLEIELETGRMHQIRVQAAARGHAVWGDAMYGLQLRFGSSSEDSRQRIIAA